MTWILKHKGYVLIVGGILVWLFREKIANALAGLKLPGAPVVPGNVSSGTKGITIDTNVLSPTFGDPI